MEEYNRTLDQMSREEILSKLIAACEEQKQLHQQMAQSNAQFKLELQKLSELIIESQSDSTGDDTDEDHTVLDNGDPDNDVNCEESDALSKEMDEFSNSLEQRHKSLKEEMQQQAIGAPGNIHLHRNLICNPKLEFPTFEVSTTIASEMFDESLKKGKLEVVIESELKDKVGGKNDKFVYEVVGEVHEVHSKVETEVFVGCKIGTDIKLIGEFDIGLEVALQENLLRGIYAYGFEKPTAIMEFDPSHDWGEDYPVVITKEPVKKWQDVALDRFIILDTFFAEPHRYAYTFQNCQMVAKNTVYKDYDSSQAIEEDTEIDRDDPHGQEIILSALETTQEGLAKPLRFKAKWQDENVKILIDGGSTVSLISEKLCQSLGTTTQEVEPIQFNFPDGTTLISTSMCPDFTWKWLQMEFTNKVHVLSLQENQVIRGVDWVSQQGDFKCNYLVHTMHFTWQCTQINLSASSTAELLGSCYQLTEVVHLWMEQIIQSYEDDLDFQHLIVEASVAVQGPREYYMAKGLLQFRGKWVIGAKDNGRRQVFEELHSKGVESGKKIAREVLALQKRVLAVAFEGTPIAAKLADIHWWMIMQMRVLVFDPGGAGSSIMCWRVAVIIC